MTYATGEATRLRLLNGAVAIARKSGLQSVNGRTVGDVAHITPGAVYYHFGNLQGLRQETVRYALAQRSSSVDALRLLVALVAMDDPFLRTLTSTAERSEIFNLAATNS